MTQQKTARWHTLAAIVSTLALALGVPSKATATPAKSAKAIKAAKVTKASKNGKLVAKSAKTAKAARAAKLARTGHNKHRHAAIVVDDDATLANQALAWAPTAHPDIPADAAPISDDPTATQPGLRPPNPEAAAQTNRLRPTGSDDEVNSEPINAYALWVPAEDAATVPLIPIHVSSSWSLAAESIRPDTLDWLDNAPEVKALQPVLDRAQATSGVDADFLKALIMVESRFRPSVVSRDGATGLMQINPRTGDLYALPAERAFAPASKRLKIPEHNIITGSRLLSDLFRRYGGRGDLVLAAWNAGEGKVRRAGGKVPAHAGVRNHIRKVFTLYAGLVEKRKRELSMASAKSAPVLLENAPPAEAPVATPVTPDVPAPAPAAPTENPSER